MRAAEAPAVLLADVADVVVAEADVGELIAQETAVRLPRARGDPQGEEPARLEGLLRQRLLGRDVLADRARTGPDRRAPSPGPTDRSSC
ncbi:hypothetical protein [Streptomyces sp. NPDC055094]